MFLLITILFKKLFTIFLNYDIINLSKIEEVNIMTNNLHVNKMSSWGGAI